MLFPNSTCTQHLTIVPSDQQTLRKLLVRYLWVYQNMLKSTQMSIKLINPENQDSQLTSP